MLYEQLAARSRQGRISFAMPGHKGGTWIAPPLHRLLELDITELPGTDNMHHPDGILRDALERIAAAYGAAHSYFSVNGSSAGILAALHFAASRCVKGIVDRNCHISVLNALCLTGLQSVYLQPQLRRTLGFLVLFPPNPSKTRCTTTLTLVLYFLLLLTTLGCAATLPVLQRLCMRRGTISL